MTELKEQVINILSNYPTQKRKIELLRYELENSSGLTESELIDAFSFSHAQGEGMPGGGRISDKTMKIALHYEDITRRLNSEMSIHITQELHALEAEVGRIEYHVGMLDFDQAEVIRLYYFEEKTWAEIKEKLHISQSVLIRRRDAGLKALAEIYSFLNKVKGNSGTAQKK